MREPHGEPYSKGAGSRVIVSRLVYSRKHGKSKYSCTECFHGYSLMCMVEEVMGYVRVGDGMVGEFGVVCDTGK